MKRWRLRALLTTLTAVAVVLSTNNPAAAAPVLAVTSIAFDRAAVDVTQDYAVVNLTWTITDRAAGAQGVSGVVELRQFVGDDQVGPIRAVTYDLSAGNAQVTGSGTAQESTYTYQFLVPRYSTAVESVWRVTKLTIADDVAHTRTVRDPGPAELAVTQLVDAAGPVAQQLYLDFDQPRAVYDDGSGVTLRYRAQLIDDAGFAKGKAVLAGPGGRRLTATFQLTPNGQQYSCGGVTVYDPTWADCLFAVTIPAGTPSGSWQIERIDLTDSLGNTRRVTSPAGPAPVQVSRNEVVSASGFALTETEVNNWQKAASTELVLKPAGAVGGLVSVDVEVPYCSQPSHTPTVRADGTVSVEIVLQSSWTASCTIEGVKLTDGAGNVALYGTTYGAPDLELTVTRVTDTKAPVVLSATLPKTTWTQQEIDDTHGLSFDVTTEVDEFARISQFSTTIYDSAGVSRGGQSGGIHDDGTGAFNLGVSTYGLAPGQYTIGFTLSDEAQNTSFWSFPNAGRPIPTGPLVLTVVAG
jgi:hypothetical protein